MKRLLLIVGLIFCAAHAHAATCPIAAGTSVSSAQAIFTACGSGNTVVIAAGAQTWGSSQITIPCGVNVTGDQTDTPSYTAWHALTYHSQKTVISTSNNNNYIFQINSGCTTAMTIQHLQTTGTGFLEIYSPNSNLTVEYNSFLNVPCHGAVGCYQTPDTLIWVNGSGASTILSNFTATWNQFGDPNSCTTPVNTMNSNADGNSGGNCSGIQTSAFLSGLTITNNSFYHLEEGVHFLCYGDNCNGVSGNTPPIPTLSNITIQNNDFQGIHRINVEMQPQGAAGINLNANTVTNPTNPFAASMGYSLACCDGNATYGLLPGDVQCYPGGPSCSSTTPATPNVPNVTNNVFVQPYGPCCGDGYAWGYTIEWWGWGSQVTHNLMQGLSVNGGATWGAGNSPWAFNYNSVCGPNMGSNIASEGYSHILAPTQTGNATLSASCSATATPGTVTFSPSSGSSVTFPVNITLTDAGNTGTTPVPQGNVSIWYTTDGSTPAPNSGTSQTCTTVGSTSCSFTLAAAGTVKAIGMWGQGANTISYPSGYGFVPSSPATASYSGGGSPSASTPTFSPGAGTYTSTQSVTMTTSSPGAIICWNTTGAPVTNGISGCTTGSLYAGAVSVAASETLYAVAGGTGYTDSSVGSAAYVIVAPSAPGFINAQFSVGVQ